MNGLRLVLTTVGSAHQAKELARRLVEERLAACVTLQPAAVSIYSWEGRLEEEPECLMLIKTMDDRLEELERRLEELHPYDTPEFLALEPSAVSDSYLAWAQAACQA